jgi:ABC-2 type transport system permease protein
MTARATPISPADAAREHAHPAWSGLLATFDNQMKSFYREPQALAFTLGQPFILLLILNTFNFHVTLPNGQTRPYLDRLLPGMIAFSGMGVGLNSIMFPLARYKERGVLRRIRATPLPTASFLGGVILSRLVIAFGVTLVTYFSGVWVFGANLTGNTLLLIAVAELGAAVFVAVGLLLVTFAKSEDDLPPLFILVLMPSLLFSGAFLDRGGLPGWLHWITNGLPLTFLTNAIQGIANLGGGFTDIQGDLLGLAVWGVLATALCSWKFKMA